MSQRLMDCAKTLLPDLCDFTEEWTGYNAKWLQECNPGQDTEITLYKTSLFDKHQN